MALISCSSAVLVSGQWEGIDGNRLRVLVVRDFTEYDQEKEEGKYAEGILLNTAKQRAVLMLIEYIKQKYPELRDSRPLEPVIIRCIDAPEILDSFCDETCCTMHAGFDIEPVLAELKNMQKPEPEAENE